MKKLRPDDVSPLSEEHRGVVLSASRRNVKVLADAQTITATSASKARELAPGDIVYFEQRKNDFFITRCDARLNHLTRSTPYGMKSLAANLDRTIIVTAPLPRFQPLAVDKLIAISLIHEIVPTIVVHKSDLGLEELSEITELYRALDLEVLVTSIKTSRGLAPLEELLRDTALNTVTLVGLSGVGKSSILNTLIPDAERRVGEISARGHGKQTTTQSHAYQFDRGPHNASLLIIDLPGIQNIGVGHLDKDTLQRGFSEIERFAHDCEFDNCSHINEESCAVKDGVRRGDIAISRYESFCVMQDEIARNKPW